MEMFRGVCCWDRSQPHVVAGIPLQADPSLAQLLHALSLLCSQSCLSFILQGCLPLDSGPSLAWSCLILSSLTDLYLQNLVLFFQTRSSSPFLGLRLRFFQRSHKTVNAVYICHPQLCCLSTTLPHRRLAQLHVLGQTGHGAQGAMPRHTPACPLWHVGSQHPPLPRPPTHTLLLLREGAARLDEEPWHLKNLHRELEGAKDPAL